MTLAAPALIDTSTSAQDERSRNAALCALYKRGAQFVICRNKVPTTKDWPDVFPTLDEVLSQGPKDVGIVPGSVGLVVIDQDSTKAQPNDKPNDKIKRNIARCGVVIETLGPALAMVASPSGGAHLLYKGTGREGNAKWAYGDIRSQKGHVVMYDPVATLEAAQRVERDATLEPVDVSLLPTESGEENKPKSASKPRPTPGELVHLAEGTRNNYLNEGVFLDARDGLLTPECETEWRNAALASGLSLSDIDATIRSASDAGSKADDGFIREKRKIVPRHQGNITLVLEKLDVRLSYDLFSKKTIVSFDGFTGPYQDKQRNRIWLTIDKQFHLQVPDGYFDIFMQDRAHAHEFHPVRDYLESLVWDNTARLDEWLIAYAKAGESTYTRAVSALMLLSAVRRIYQPGVKFDEMVVLESEQGTGKSSLLRALCPYDGWFSDDLPLNVDAKQIIERTRGKWIIEAAELSGMHSSKVEHLKSMMSRQVDGPVRMAYARLGTEEPRQFVFVGTTNAHVYLNDPTGDRRFWPLQVQKIDVDAVKRDRDQLWAEAVVRHKRGDSIRLSPELYEQAQIEQERRRAIDPWEPLIEEEFSEEYRRVVPREIWKVLGISTDRMDARMAKRVAEVMQRLGFRRMSVWDSEEDKTTKGWGRGSHQPKLTDGVREGRL